MRPSPNGFHFAAVHPQRGERRESATGCPASRQRSIDAALQLDPRTLAAQILPTI